MLTVNLFESSATVATFMNLHSYTLPVLLDATTGMSMKYGVAVIPMTFIIGRDGIIKTVHRGPYSSLAQIKSDLAKAD